MLRIADRVIKTFADVTVGSVIVLVHMAIADRELKARDRESETPDRVRRSSSLPS